MSDKSVATRGGGFLLADIAPEDVFIPEQFGDEHLMIGRMAEGFIQQEVRPRLDQLESGDHAATRSLLRAAGKLGLLGADVPEAYGGLGLSKVATTLITEKIARGASFGISFGAHVGIGTLPIVFFGNDSQKARYLPALATGEKLAAYALTEPNAGSDALGGKTAARLSEDGRHYVLNGQKQWITNSGFADVIVLYAKVDGEKMTAFIVERGFPGVSVGPEHKKMGLLGSSTCDVYLSDVRVPVENVLGEMGRGHIIAFNILNIGRWKLAAGCVGSCKVILEVCARYARERRQFGRAIAEFPAVQQKLAQMAARTFALESMVYRTAHLFDQALDQEGAARDPARAIGEYAVEASINKIFGSEALDFVVDEGVQIHGGYGYIRGFEVERAYRDARINRIFEGTNEINRLLIPSTLLRRALKGELPFMQAVQRAQVELSAGPTPRSGTAGAAMGGATSALNADAEALANLKRAALLVSGLGVQKYMARAEEEQEFLLGVADLAILVYAWESALVRARRVRESPAKAEAATDMALLFGDWAMEQGEAIVKRTLAGMERGDALQVQLALARRLFRRVPANTVELGRRIARRVLTEGGSS